MAKKIFKPDNQGQTILFASGLDEKIPHDSPVRMINQIVDNLDITKVVDTPTRVEAQAPIIPVRDDGLRHLCHCIQYTGNASKTPRQSQKHDNISPKNSILCSFFLFVQTNKANIKLNKIERSNPKIAA
ncbi:MAG: hypothetical protein QM751_02815 [Paludibacteraceae bacterium]